MTSARFEAWQPQAPSAGFADRVTDAVLRDLGARAVEAPRRRARARQWALLGVAAAILVASGAFAWTSRPAHVELLEPVSPSQRADPLPIVSVRQLPAAAPRPVEKPVIPPARSRPVATPPPAAPPAPTDVRVPQCRCNEYACDCGPE